MNRDISGATAAVLFVIILGGFFCQWSSRSTGMYVCVFILRAIGIDWSYGVSCIIS